MYFTYVVRPGDAPEGKGPQFQPFWDGLMNWTLRSGFLLKSAGILTIVIAGLIGGQPFHIFSILAVKTAALGKVPILVAFLGALMCTLGAVALQNFRSIADDDASIRHTRGFRAGIKGLHHASMLEIVSWGLTSILLYSTMKYFDDDWATAKSGSSSNALLASCARTLHALALILYGNSVFMMETFHAQGTAELWAWTISLLLHAAGISEIFAMIFDSNSKVALVFDVAFTVTLLLGLLVSLFWSLAFEQVIQQDDVKLTQSAMRNEFYKSKNSMSYYGPPAGNSIQDEVLMMQQQP